MTHHTHRPPVDHTVIIQLKSSLYDCPTWWQNMIDHLVVTHDPWHMQNTHQIIGDHLWVHNQAIYHEPDLNSPWGQVTFDDHHAYCACVLQWS